MDATATVATYNILHGVQVASSGESDLQEVARTIGLLGADVVAVQEVDRSLARSGGIDQVAWLADGLGWFGVFAPALLGDPDRSWVACEHRDPGGPAYGVGLLSRYPLTGARRRPLPGRVAGQRRRPASPSRPGWDREPRTALTATITTSAGPLCVMTTHLSYLPWRALRQLRVAARGVRGAQRALLLGDLNLPTRCVRVALPTWDHHSGPPTYPAGKPRMQVDQISSRGLDVQNVRVSQRGASDHLPLLADVAIQ